MDIYAATAPALERRAHQWGHWGCQGSCKWGSRVAQEFVGFAWLRLPTGGVWQGHQQTSH